MDYVGVVNILFSSLFSFMGVLVFHFIIFGIVGTFFKKKYPKSEKKLKYGIIIPARNEEMVVGNLIKSIQECDYPKDKLHIFLIAHNCTDKTAEIGRSLGVTVYEYNNPNECTMGYAFRYLFDKIEEDFGTQSYDGFFLFNADNVVSKNYFDKMNDAFVAGDRKNVVTSFRNSKNFGSNPISAMYGLYFMYGCRFEARGRALLGCSTRVQGTGYVISSEIVKDGWKYVTLTEDWEFTADQLLVDTKILYCDEAVFYDEQPTSLKVMWNQRVRWARGHLLVYLSRYFDLLKAFFKPAKKGGSKHKCSIYDLSVNILPIGVIGVGLALAHLVALLFAPLFGEYDLLSVIIGYLKAYALSIGYSYISVILSAFVIIFIERNRIPKTSPITMAIAILFWPAFVLLAAPCDVVALFSKNLGWKPIPHTNSISIKDIK